MSDKSLVRWKLEYDGPINDRYARHVEDPNGGWVAWSHVEQLLAQVETLTAERDKFDREVQDWRATYRPKSALVIELEQTSKELRALQAAVREVRAYVQHKPECEVVNGGARVEGDHFSFAIPGQRKCTCGLDSRLAGLGITREGEKPR